MLLRFFGLVLDVLLLPLRLAFRLLAVPRGAFVCLTVDGAVVDVVEKPRFWQIRKQRATSLHLVARLVDEVARDGRVRGVLVTVREMSCGMAGATSLRALLLRARAAGKEVVVHLPMGGGTKEVFVSSAASKIVVAPATHLAPVGFLSQTRYVRRALDRAGIEPEVLACGEYKSAGENLVRDSMSEAQREQLDRLLGGFHAAVVSGIAEGRGVTEDRAAAMIDGAPYSADAALACGLADAIGHEDDVAGILGLNRRRQLLDAAGYVAHRSRPLFRAIRAPRTIAVIPVHGAIAHAAGPLGSFGSFATDDAVTKLVRAARLDRRVRGVVLHIDSPGGSALASDRMHHEIVQLAREKPVVACMANVAASGGYYVAAPAHRIVAEPTTVTGSIGVVAARLSFDALLERVGVTTEVVRRGARAGLLGAATRIDDEERAALRRELDATYRIFVDVVARGRKMSPERVEALARGRVYTGADAHAVGLVDVLGGLDAAIREVEAMLPPKLRGRLVVTPARAPRRSIHPLEPAKEGDAGRRTLAALVEALFSDTERVMFELACRGERVLALISCYIPRR